MEPLEILYSDEHLVAVDKPAGMLVHRSSIDRRERDSVLDRLRAQLGRPLHLLHRLDKPVSGVLLLGLDVHAARMMTAAFESARVHKRYVAIVRGHAPPEGVIDHALREMRDEISDARARSGKAAQPAVTTYERLATAELPLAAGRYPTARYSLVRLWPQTGRRHQLPRHLKHISHPIVGDTTHGDGRQNRFAREHLGCERLLLCAQAVEFPHPVTGEALTVTALPDAHFAAVARKLGWKVGGPDEPLP
jgi:tRNA pseudouridine65 synthase